MLSVPAADPASCRAAGSGRFGEPPPLVSSRDPDGGDDHDEPDDGHGFRDRTAARAQPEVNGGVPRFGRRREQRAREGTPRSSLPLHERPPRGDQHAEDAELRRAGFRARSRSGAVSRSGAPIPATPVGDTGGDARPRPPPRRRVPAPRARRAPPMPPRCRYCRARAPSPRSRRRRRRAASQRERPPASDSPAGRYSRVTCPAMMRSTSTFHSSFLRTVRLPASPILTSSPAISTSGHALQAGQSENLVASMMSSSRSVR